MLNKNNRIFNSPFHFFFDRNDNFNCFVSFNFYEFLKNYATYPELYEIDEFYNLVKSSVILEFYLVLEDKDSIRLHTEQQIKIQNLQEINLLNNAKITSYILNIPTTNINRKYTIKGVVTFSGNTYTYLQQFLDRNIDLQLFSEAHKIKDTFEKKYYNSFSSFVPSSTYEFYSDVIDFSKKLTKVSVLHKIFNTAISRQTLSEHIQTYETIKGVKYDGNLPITTFIVDNREYSFNYNIQAKQGSTDEYLRLSMSLLNNLINRKDYKKFSYANNIYLLDNLAETKNNETVKPYEYISAIQSDACESEVQQSVKVPALLDSDILLVSTFFDNFSIIKPDDFWVEDTKAISVYLLELLTKYNIVYLSNIDSSTLNESWSQLTKEELQNLNSGKYLCMISADQDYIQNSIIENYFILEI